MYGTANTIFSWKMNLKTNHRENVLNIVYLCAFFWFAAQKINSCKRAICENHRIVFHVKIECYTRYNGVDFISNLPLPTLRALTRRKATSLRVKVAM